MCASLFELTGEVANSVWHPVFELKHLMKKEKTDLYGGSKPFSFWFFESKMFYGEEFQLTFSCHFQFTDFPFDSHECPLEYGDKIYDTENLNFNSSHIIHGNKSIRFGDSPMMIGNLPFPFDFQLEALPALQEVSSYGPSKNYSYTGMVLKMKRKSLGQLHGAFYYPTTSFAFLSMISFLIKPDVVRYIM